MGKNNSASFGDCPTDEGGGGGGGSSNSKRPLSSSLTAERKRRQRQKSNELRKTLADCLEQVHQEHGGLTEVQNALEAKQPMRHQDLLEATISAIKWPKYQDFITRPHRPQVEKSPAPAHLQSDFDWMHKIAMLRSSMLGAIMVTTEDLVVKESSSAVKQFAPWDILDGYLGQSLWAMTCCRDFPVLEHMFTELLPVEREGLTGRKMRIRLKRIGKDVHSDNLLSKFVWQSVTIAWVSPDLSRVLMTFEPLPQDLLPLAAGDEYWDSKREGATERWVMHKIYDSASGKEWDSPDSHPGDVSFFSSFFSKIPPCVKKQEEQRESLVSLAWSQFMHAALSTKTKIFRVWKRGTDGVGSSCLCHDFQLIPGFSVGLHPFVSFDTSASASRAMSIHKSGLTDTSLLFADQYYHAIQLPDDVNNVNVNADNMFIITGLFLSKLPNGKYIHVGAVDFEMTPLTPTSGLAEVTLIGPTPKFSSRPPDFFRSTAKYGQLSRDTGTNECDMQKAMSFLDMYETTPAFVKLSSGSITNLLGENGSDVFWWGSGKTDR